MKYCKNCGKEVDDAAIICPYCGVQLEAIAPADIDSGSIGWGLLGCCIPIVGLILFLVWKDQKPRTAKMAGLGALISVLAAVAFYVIAALVGVGAGLLSI